MKRGPGASRPASCPAACGALFGWRRRARRRRPAAGGTATTTARDVSGADLLVARDRLTVDAEPDDALGAIERPHRADERTLPRQPVWKRLPTRRGALYGVSRSS